VLCRAVQCYEEKVAANIWTHPERCVTVYDDANRSEPMICHSAVACAMRNNSVAEEGMRGRSRPPDCMNSWSGLLTASWMRSLVRPPKQVFSRVKMYCTSTCSRSSTPWLDCEQERSIGVRLRGHYVVWCSVVS
jgi:hypothetical protein